MKNKAMDLTQGSITRNLVKLSLPIMFSNFLQMFYNLTDAFWLGKLGENARGAVSAAGIAFPLIFFLSSFGFGFVIAGTSLISQYKGANRFPEMKRVVGQFVILVVIFCAFFLIFSFVFLDNILHLLQVPSEIYEVTKQYISVILVGMVFMFLFLSYQSFSHGMGDTISPMKVQLVSVIINVLVDPLLIFGVGFFPRLEAVGAAYATLFARLIGAVIALIYFMKKDKVLIPTVQDLIPDKVMLKKILNISIPASLGQSVTSFGFLLLQGFVNSFGTVVITVFSIGNRLTGFFMMPAMGMSNALATIVGQNLGARKVDRAIDSVKRAFLLIMTIMLIGCAILYFFGSDIVKFFIDDKEVVQTGVRMFRVSSFATFIFGIVFIFMGVFNGSGHTKPTMILNIVRLWGLRIPFVLLLSGLALEYIKIDFLIPFLQWISKPLAEYPYDALWWSMIISNGIIAIWAFLIYEKGEWKKGKI